MLKVVELFRVALNDDQINCKNTIKEIKEITQNIYLFRITRQKYLK